MRALEDMHCGHRNRLRNRYLGGGLDVFAPHEALELLLFYAIPRRDTNPIAHMLLSRFGSLSAVLNASVEELQTVEGVGENAAVLLNLVPKLCQTARLNDARRSAPSLQSPEAAGKLLLTLFAGETTEQIYQLCLNQRGQLLTCHQLGNHTAPWSALNTRQVVENALSCSAASIILSHNHPSGSTDISKDDLLATQTVQNALSPIGIRLEDHIVVAGGAYLSLRQLGLLF